MNLYLSYNEAHNSARLQYVLEVLQNHPLVKGKVLFVQEDSEGETIQIDYGFESGGSYFIPAQDLFFKYNNEIPTDLFANAYHLNGNTLYSIENQAKEKDEFIQDGRFSFDILEMIFFHLSRFEELSTNTESSKKTKEQDLFLVSHKLNKIPVVDQLIQAFLETLGVSIKKRTEFVLTHDIDKVYKFNSIKDGIKAIAWPLFHQLSVKGAFRNLFSFIKVKRGLQKDPYDSYDFLFRTNEIWKKKIVYFMAGGNSRFDLYDKYYKKYFPEILYKAKKAGYRTGLHSSYNTIRDINLMESEKKHLSQLVGYSVTDNRQHFLNLEIYSTFSQLEKLGFTLDSTLGYTRRIGFRSGTGFAYKLYDFINEGSGEMVELPLVVMDSSLIHETKEDMSAFKKELFEFIETNAYNTLITFNFHNSSFDFTLQHRRLLEKIYNELEEFVAKSR